MSRWSALESAVRFAWRTAGPTDRVTIYPLRGPAVENLPGELETPFDDSGLPLEGITPTCLIEADSFRPDFYGATLVNDETGVQYRIFGTEPDGEGFLLLRLAAI